MTAVRKLWKVIFALIVGILASGCAGPENKQLTLGDKGWDEGVAISNLTKALLENELGYDRVELKTLDADPLFEGVRDGGLDAFQDVWIPNDQEHLSAAQDDLEVFDPWFQDITKVGIAAPSYMNITSIPQLNQTGATEILGVEPEAPISRRVPDEVVPTYKLQQEYEEWSTSAMLFDLGERIRKKEEFAFIAWSPHWMNQRYDFIYLDDPDDALGELDDSSSITTVVHKDLMNKDPEAYAFLKALTLTEEQLEDLEEAINAAGDPLAGAEQWAENNREVVQPWLDAAKQAQQKT
jgi:glycine betaine/proline transport system substrate-binding protein